VDIVLQDADKLGELLVWRDSYIVVDCKVIVR
jgi:hypothetical protein